jgi:hypothetical protein
MRRPAFFFLSLVLVFSPAFLRAQQDVGPSSQGISVLLASLRALAPATTVKDVTLSGTGQWIAGSEDETGRVTVKALAGFGSRLDLSLPSGKRSDVRTNKNGDRIGSWMGPGGISHPVSHHNLIVDSGFFPQFTLWVFASSPDSVVEYVGPETHSGADVIHLTVFAKAPSQMADVDAWMRRLSRTEIFLDRATLLPVAVAFNVHPDDNDLVDIPVEMAFSDYRDVTGTHIPFHVRKFLNRSLTLDLQFETAVLNSGLSVTDFDQP